MATFGSFVDGVSLKASELNGLFAWTSITPVVRQSGTVTIASGALNLYANYSQVNKFVIFGFHIITTGAGTAGNRIEIDLPVTAASSSVRVIGSATFLDVSANDVILANAVQVSTTRMAFITQTATSLTSYLGTTNGPAITLANNDVIAGFIRYEAA